MIGSLVNRENKIRHKSVLKKETEVLVEIRVGLKHAKKIVGLDRHVINGTRTKIRMNLY